MDRVKVVSVEEGRSIGAADELDEWEYSYNAKLAVKLGEGSLKDINLQVTTRSQSLDEARLTALSELKEELVKVSEAIGKLMQEYRGSGYRPMT